MAGQSEHEDIGAGTEDSILEAGNHDRAHFRMLKAETLDRVVKLDVYPEIVRIELEFVAFADTTIFRDIHCQRRNRPGKAQTPMPVMEWRSTVVDSGGASRFQLLVQCLCSQNLHLNSCPSDAKSGVTARPRRRGSGQVS